MKKIFAAAAIVFAASVSLTAYAASSSVSIKNNDPASDGVTYTYTAGDTEMASASVKSLMTGLEALTERSSVLQTLTVTSETADGSPIELFLIISLPDKPQDAAMPETAAKYSENEYNSLCCYSLRVTGADGAVVYEESAPKADGAEYREIPLGIMNETEGSESKIFNITVSVNKTYKDLKRYAEKLDWSIGSRAVKASAAAAPVTGASLGFASGEYICGTDLDEGKYTVTGSGRLSVYASDGALKSVVTLKNADGSEGGVEEYTVTLESGEKVVIDGDMVFGSYAEGAVKAAAAPQTTAGAAAEAQAEQADNKNGVVIGVIGAAAFAAAVCVFTGYKKRKGKNE